MDKLIDNFPYKKILFLNWYQAALAHLLLFKSLVQKHSNNVYFLISDQGILLKATSLDYLKKADDEITKFFTAKIEQLQISASGDFYNHIIEDIKQQTDKLKQNKDCPYINLVYSEKFRNSCVAMKKLGYVKPYQNWQCHERQRKGFCYLIVRPEYRWKQIASNVYTLVRKRQNNHQKSSKQKPFPLQICYQKFLWFYLKKSFNRFKKSLQIKQNKGQKRLTIVIKNEIPELKDFQRQIDVLNFFYIPSRPPIQQKQGSKTICLSSLQVQKITQLIYHQFGLPAFVKQLRKKMSGYLVIGISDNTQAYQSISNDELQIKQHFSLQDKEDICKINNNKLTFVVKLSNRYQLISYQGSNYIQVRLDKPIKQNIIKILKIRLPCLPKYYYWFQKEDGFYLIRNYYTQTLSQVFQNTSLYNQIFMLYSLISIVQQLHLRQIYIGNALNQSVYVEDKRIIIQPDQKSTKQKDIQKLIIFLKQLNRFIRDQQKKYAINQILQQKRYTTLKINKYLLEYIDSRS